MKIFLIRHSTTEGNKNKRYIGITDEPLCEEGRELLFENMKASSYPEVERVYVSPLSRCQETAEIIYEDHEKHIIENLRECDFGLFENKNYLEMSDLPEYQTWVDAGGLAPFPEGESKEGFTARTLEGFHEALKRCKCDGIDRVAFVVHGGSIMSIMETYAYPSGAYYDFHVENGEGYELVMAVDDSGVGRVPSGSSFGGSQMAVPSSESDWTSYHFSGKNYQKLF